MNRFRALALTLIVALTSACSTDEEPTRKHSTVAADPGSPSDNTDGTNTGGDASGVLLLDLTAASVTGAVGQQVAVTAQGWLDAGKTKPVTSGTVISFAYQGPVGTVPNIASANASGQASVNVKATAAGPVTVTASLDGVTSLPATIQFVVPGTGGSSGGGGTVVAPKVGGVTVGFSKLSVYVNNDSSADTSDEANVYITVVDQAGSPLKGQVVNFFATTGSLSSITGTTNASGTIGPIKYTAGILAGTDVVSATVGGINGEASIVVGPGAPLIVDVQAPTPAQIGVLGSGNNESSVVEIWIFDKYGNRVSDGTVVNFSVVPAIGGVTVSPASTTTHGGRVAPVVNAGTTSGSVRLVATIPSIGRSVSSSKITIFGGTPSQSRFNMAADIFVLSGAIWNNLVSTLTITLTDRYGNPVPTGTAIHVVCEAGRCGENTVSGISTNAQGNAIFEVATANQNNMWSSGATTTVNFAGTIGTNHKWPPLGDPRDGQIAVLAYTIGESGFDDSNSNGIFDGGDLLTDALSEPFLDVNSNGARDVTGTFIEEFRDFDGDLTFDAAPGTYQAQAYIWTQYTLIWSSYPAPYAGPNQFVDVNGDGLYDPDEDYVALGGPAPASQIQLLSRFPSLPATAQLYPGYASYNSNSTVVAVNFTDINNNPLPDGSSIAPEVTGAHANVATPNPGYTVYGASRTPLPPRLFFLDSDANAVVNDTLFTYCSRVTLDDINNVFPLCVTGIVF